MATSKEYAWYIEGNEIAVVEKDVSFDNDVNNKDYGPGASRQKWNSPKTTIADGLKVKYVYAPNYIINSTSQTSDDITTYSSSGSGKLVLASTVGSADFTNGTNVTNMSAVTDIVLTNAGKFNGHHKITNVTATALLTDTAYTGTTNYVTFEEAVVMYYNISMLEDESFDLDLPLYLQKALVYYVKGKLAEDAGELKLREYAMREFKKMIEKHANSRISGVRITTSGSHAIR